MLLLLGQDEFGSPVRKADDSGTLQDYEDGVTAKRGFAFNQGTCFQPLYLNPVHREPVWFILYGSHGILDLALGTGANSLPGLTDSPGENL